MGEGLFGPSSSARRRSRPEDQTPEISELSPPPRPARRETPLSARANGRPRRRPTLSLLSLRRALAAATAGGAAGDEEDDAKDTAAAAAAASAENEEDAVAAANNRAAARLKLGDNAGALEDAELASSAGNPRTSRPGSAARRRTTHWGDSKRASEDFKFVLRLEPKNTQALQGMERIKGKKPMPVKLENFESKCLQHI